MNGIKKRLATGLVVTMTALAVIVPPVSAQVGQSGYGEGPGASGVQSTSQRGGQSDATITATSLPRTGDADPNGPILVWLALAGAATAALGLGTRLAARRRATIVARGEHQKPR